VIAHFRRTMVTIVILSSFAAAPAVAKSCLAPQKPYLPSAPREVRAYADLLRQDFETYLSAVSDYLQCLDRERARAFREAQDVTEQYERFVEIVSD